MTRQEFIRLCGSSCLAIAGMSIFTESAVAAIHKTEQEDEGKLTVDKAKFVKKKGKDMVYRKYLQLTAANIQFPIILYRFDEDDYAALLMQCTHRGSELNINGDMLTCPAHDSEFSNRGEVLQGPADEPLKTFTVTTDEQNIYINLA